ncbi:unnamed protein product [Somion occarium]|uniref:Kinase-like protein n=1 Tax=Somion occarium TaxID=3059160 RepID=A0ABP1CT63_9APHY
MLSPMRISRVTGKSLVLVRLGMSTKVCYRSIPPRQVHLLASGTYLGIEVAIKEVLPSTEYDVAKYFEREWRLMKEARHPNVVLYLGLSRAPSPDGRIFIISEFIENGNLRAYIHDKSKPFPWRLRLSFATDIARALAYLHARKCIHRDLKGENLLVTANGRLKITDFGFARIAARNEEESKRLTFCGTDSYMSPEILLGHEFDLPTDIFSLGVILSEIASRKLASETVFRRSPPSFGVDSEEVETLASTGCPPAFIKLCLDCLAEEPSQRPTTREILDRLRDIEAEVIARSPATEDVHVGSIRYTSSTRRPGPAPRIPSFGMGVGQEIRYSSQQHDSVSETSEDESSDDELTQAVMGLKHLDLESTWSHSSSRTGEGSTQPLIHGSSTYSTTVVRSHTPSNDSAAPSLSSILTVRPSPSVPSAEDIASPPAINDLTPTDSILSIESYHTASSSILTMSIAGATEGGSTIRSSHIPLLHRFTLIKPGVKRNGAGSSRSGSASPPRYPPTEALWNPLDFLFNGTSLAAKCDVCNKRLGWKPMLECDDCGLRAHIKCAEVAPADCGLRPIRRTPASPAKSSPLSKTHLKNVASA